MLGDNLPEGVQCNHSKNKHTHHSVSGDGHGGTVMIDTYECKVCGVEFKVTETVCGRGHSKERVDDTSGMRHG